jgi:hypothetical protein
MGALGQTVEIAGKAVGPVLHEDRAVGHPGDLIKA